MQIAAMSMMPTYSYARAAACAYAPPAPPMMPSLLQMAAVAGSNERLAAFWANFQLTAPAPQAPPFPSTELSRGQNFQAGSNQVAVDQGGNMDVSVPGATTTNVSVAGVAAGLSNCYGSEGAGAVAATASTSQKPPMGFRVEGGQIVCPNGKRVPFGNRGVIIELPDGTQVGAGRNSDTDTQNCRWVTAGPGQQIPTEPPGKTNLFRLDQQGNLTPAGVK